jgi:hypothetical protein
MSTLGDDLRAMAATVRFFVDNEIPLATDWNVNPTVLQNALVEIAGGFDSAGGGGGAPSGAAGGALAGTYPNPILGPLVVSDANIHDVDSSKVTRLPTAVIGAWTWFIPISALGDVTPGIAGSAAANIPAVGGSFPAYINLTNGSAVDQTAAFAALQPGDLIAFDDGAGNVLRCTVTSASMAPPDYVAASLTVDALVGTAPVNGTAATITLTYPPPPPIWVPASVANFVQLAPPNYGVMVGRPGALAYLYVGTDFGANFGGLSWVGVGGPNPALAVTSQTTLFLQTGNGLAALQADLDGHVVLGGGTGLNPPYPEALAVLGGVVLGAALAATPAAGTIQWNGTNFQGFNGTAWVNLDN